MGQWVGGCGTMNAKEDTVVAVVVAWGYQPAAPKSCTSRSRGS